jgi:hypothetical protein
MNCWDVRNPNGVAESSPNGSETREIRAAGQSALDLAVSPV